MSQHYKPKREIEKRNIAQLERYQGKKALMETWQGINDEEYLRLKVEVDDLEAKLMVKGLI